MDFYNQIFAFILIVLRNKWCLISLRLKWKLIRFTYNFKQTKIVSIKCIYVYSCEKRITTGYKLFINHRGVLYFEYTSNQICLFFISHELYMFTNSHIMHWITQCNFDTICTKIINSITSLRRDNFLSLRYYLRDNFRLYGSNLRLPQFFSC